MRRTFQKVCLQISQWSSDCTRTHGSRLTLPASCVLVLVVLAFLLLLLLLVMTNFLPSSSSCSSRVLLLLLLLLLSPLSNFLFALPSSLSTILMTVFVFVPHFLACVRRSVSLFLEYTTKLLLSTSTKVPSSKATPSTSNVA